MEEIAELLRRSSLVVDLKYIIILLVKKMIVHKEQ